MTQNMQLAARENQSITTPTADEFQVMREQSQMLVTTGFLPKAVDTPEKAMAIILTGRELGIPTMCALRSIDVIQGKPTVSPQLMMALIERSGQLENKVVSQNEQGVTCILKRRGRAEHKEFFGFAEAKALQLDQKENYKKQPFTMFRWRAVAACARVVFPDVILGLYTPEEMGADFLDESELETIPRERFDSAVRTTPADIAPAQNRETAETPHAAPVTTQEAIWRDEIENLLKNSKINPQKTLTKFNAVSHERREICLYEARKTAIKHCFQEMDWDGNSIADFLSEHDISGLEFATNHQLAEVISTMRKNKMLLENPKL